MFAEKICLLCNFWLKIRLSRTESDLWSRSEGSVETGGGSVETIVSEKGICGAQLSLFVVGVAEGFFFQNNFRPIGPICPHLWFGHYCFLQFDIRFTHVWTVFINVI